MQLINMIFHEKLTHRWVKNIVATEFLSAAAIFILGGNILDESDMSQEIRLKSGK